MTGSFSIGLRSRAAWAEFFKHLSRGSLLWYTVNVNRSIVHPSSLHSLHVLTEAECNALLTADKLVHIRANTFTIRKDDKCNTFICNEGFDINSIEKGILQWIDLNALIKGSFQSIKWHSCHILRVGIRGALSVAKFSAQKDGEEN